MLTKKEIVEIAINELKKYKLNTKIKVLNFKLFNKKALESPIIKQSLKEGNLLEELTIPALVSHKTNTIYLSEETVRKLLKDEPITIQTRFIKSIVHHEIYHILEKKQFSFQDFDNALRLEEEATKKFKKHYPGLAALGRRICKKYISE